MKLKVVLILVMLLPVRWVPGPKVLRLGAGVAFAQEAEEEEGEEEGDPPQVTIGERLFLETRFAQWFAAKAAGPNAPLPAGDPTLDVTTTTGTPLPGAFAGRSMSCRACHLVDEQHFTPNGGNRTYADFARRSPIPARSDGLLVTPRNSPPLVGVARGAIFHTDGEFRTLVDLVEATFTGRNFGWLPDEHDQAVRHIATIIREDDGSGLLARSFGGAYRDVFRGGALMPDELRLPLRFRMDVRTASDKAIVRLVARLVTAYVQSLEFITEGRGFDGSPFDIFLERNGIPRAPKPVQSHLAYSREVRGRLDAIAKPAVVQPDGAHVFALHDQPFQFGPDEIRGLRIFLREGSADGTAVSGVGNCIACHPLPAFSDLKLHNTGVSQREYDAAHGDGAFAALAIPDLATRDAAPDAWLPASPQHPTATGPFRQPAEPARPGLADLGAWNTYANPDLAKPRLQRRLADLVCEAQGPATCRAIRRDPPRLLDASIGLFKTPILRDLGHSQPYMHDGSFDELEDVVTFYRDVSDLARRGALRNAAPEIAGIRLGPDDVAPLAAFLRALNEDYE
jgi:hypothetical protein